MLEWPNVTKSCTRHVHYQTVQTGRLLWTAWAAVIGFKLDLAFAFHGLPAPDSDLEILFEKAATDMQESNPYDETFFMGFLKYAQASDLCKALFKSKADTKWISDDDYDPTQKKWFARAQQVPGVLLPKEEWGEARLYKHFAYNESIDNWFMSASDVTRVIPEEAPYESQMASRKIDQHNELLYAMKHAPMLAPGVTPEKRLKEACKRGVGSPHMVVVAAKSKKLEHKTGTQDSCHCSTSELVNYIILWVPTLIGLSYIHLIIDIRM